MKFTQNPKSPAVKINLLVCLCGLVLAVLISGCAGAARRADFHPSPGWTETGTASWYGESYRGRRTASGEIFNPNALTAAHQELPFGSVVRVRNLNNHRQVLVRINDRGPFVSGRIIDLSERAARQLGMRAAGVVPVKITLIRYAN